MSLILGIAAVALLFALVGVLPLQHRNCDGCSGDCAHCPMEEEVR